MASEVLPERLTADGPVLHGDGWEIVIGHGSLETTHERLIARVLAHRYNAHPTLVAALRDALDFTARYLTEAGKSRGFYARGRAALRDAKDLSEARDVPSPPSPPTDATKAARLQGA